MSSSASFDHLLAVSRLLEDDFIDEDIQDIQRGSGSNARKITNRMITVRGKHHGRPLVLSYQDYYTTNFNPNAPEAYELNILEVFATQRHVSFEGRIRQRNVFDKIGRWFGMGGTKGQHPIFSRMRVDVEEGSAECFGWVDFPPALEKLALRHDVGRVTLQVGSGLTAIASWNADRSSAQYVMELVDEVCAVAGTLDQAGRG